MRYESTILVVEDEPCDQLLIQKAFRALGLTGPILFANDGVEAIDYLMGEGKYADRSQGQTRRKIPPAQPTQTDPSRPRMTRGAKPVAPGSKAYARERSSTVRQNVVY